MNEQLGLLLLSCVRHQRSYAPMFSAHPDVKIVAVADDPDIPQWMHEVNQGFAEEYDIAYIRDVDEALARPDVQMVSICSEPTRHANLVIRAAASGKHVFVDKPMATTVADADAVREALRQSDQTFTYVHRLYSPEIQRMRADIDRGDVGLPYALHMSFISAGGLTSGSVEDFQLVVDRNLSGGGELMNFLGYPVETARYLTGLEVTQVYASAGNYFFEPHREHGVEDFGTVCLTLEKGVTATAIVGRSPTQTHQAAGDYSIRVHGSTGTLVGDELRPRLAIYAGTSAPRSRASTSVSNTILAPVISGFIDAVQGGQQPLRSVEDGRANIAVIEAAYRSLASGRVEEVAR